MDCVIFKMNPDKTEFIIIGDKHTRESVIPKFTVSFLQRSIFQAEKVKIQLPVIQLWFAVLVTII